MKDRLRTRRHRRDPQRGAAAVEFALVITLLMIIVMGMIDYAFYFYVDHVVTGAAREGARAASLWDTLGSADTDGIATVDEYLARGGLNSSLDTTTVVQDTVGTPTAVSYVVSVSYPVGSITGFLGSTLIPANASAVVEFRRQ